MFNIGDIVKVAGDVSERYFYKVTKVLDGGARINIHEVRFRGNKIFLSSSKEFTGENSSEFVLVKSAENTSGHKLTYIFK